jgi:hypothetical protein
MVHILSLAGSKLVSFLPSKPAPNTISGVEQDPKSGLSPEDVAEVSVLDDVLVAVAVRVAVLVEEKLLIPPVELAPVPETMLPWLSTVATLAKFCQNESLLTTDDPKRIIDNREVLPW